MICWEQFGMQKRNNQHMPDYDKNKPSNSITYEDANNLYGSAISKFLPYKDLKFESSVELADILKTADDNDIGYIVEVDVHFPIELHAKFKELPPTCDMLTPQFEWLRNYQLKVAEKTRLNR